MSAAPKLAAFAVALAGVFGVATFAGATVGPERVAESAANGDESGAGGHGMAKETTQNTKAGSEAVGHVEGDTAAARAAGGHAGASDPVRGLAVSEDGLTLALDRDEFERGGQSDLRFRILREDGSPVRDYDIEHEKRMHVVVVRRDGSGFQHVHPELSGDGTWSVPVTLPDAGAYRVFADFSHDGEARTLAADVRVDGDADYRPLPAPQRTVTTSDGYVVRVDAQDVRAGEEAELAFTVERDGTRVTPEPYLGARGHLVALREGDLAFLHVHPDEDSLAFMAEFPSAGRYGLYLQFKHDGRVHTAAFTQDVDRGATVGEDGS